MTDRELLEAAAKAAGIGGGWDWPRGADKPTCWRDSSRKAWQPLHDDGDALRLAVKLKIELQYFGAATVQARVNDWPIATEYVNMGADPYAATRRAIVRAAAELAK